MCLTDLVLTMGTCCVTVKLHEYPVIWKSLVMCNNCLKFVLRHKMHHDMYYQNWCITLNLERYSLYVTWSPWPHFKGLSSLLNLRQYFVIGQFLHNHATWAHLIYTTDTARFASCLDMHLEIDNKRNDFNIPLRAFHLCVATFQKHLHVEYIALSW